MLLATYILSEEAFKRQNAGTGVGKTNFEINKRAGSNKRVQFPARTSFPSKVVFLIFKKVMETKTASLQVIMVTLQLLTVVVTGRIFGGRLKAKEIRRGRITDCCLTTTTRE